MHCEKYYDKAMSNEPHQNREAALL